MNDEWKMPGTEQEENQQPVGEESEVTEATAVKEPEAGKPQKQCRRRQKVRNLKYRSGWK